ncbi:MAG: hypothetical protein LBR64_08080 [Dysgonamonadaceae bacterium]|nr:hypothetical protein [Dysgonamonadaceae bacterium]
MNFTKQLFALIMVCFLFCSHNLKGQVTIGKMENPIKGALMQFKTVDDETSDGEANAALGIGFPRVALVQRDQLQPMYSAAEAAALDDKTRQAHRGLVVYNVTSNADLDLEQGIYVWDGEKWVETQGDIIGRAVFEEVNCSAITVYGAYTQNLHTDNSNYITLTLNALKKGAYTITATAGNGYSFMAQGIAMEKGAIKITLMGQGIPKNPQTDNLSFDGIKLADASCLPTITVTPPTATYSVDCSTISVNGNYESRVPTTAANTITVPVYVSVANPGAASYEIYTNTVDGLWFSTAPGSSFTNTGYQNVTLYAHGMPTSARDKKFKLNINSADGAETDCEFQVKMLRHKMKILSCGASIYSTHNTTIKAFMDDVKNFGPNGVIKGRNFDWTEISDDYSASAHTKMVSAISGNDRPDILSISYNFYPLPPSADEVDALKNYVDEGGVLLLFGSDSKTASLDIANAILGASMTSTDISTNDNPYNFLTTLEDDDPLMEGPFGSCRNGKWGEDNGGTFYFTNVPDDVVIYSSTWAAGQADIPGSATILRSKNKNFVCVNDAWGSSSTATGSSEYPCFFKNNKPVTKWYGPAGKETNVYNSIFYANIIAWAVERAQFFGVNADKYN